MLLLALIGLCQLFLSTNARRVFPYMLHLTASWKSFSLVEFYFFGNGNLVLSQGLYSLVNLLFVKDASKPGETFLYKHVCHTFTYNTFDARPSQLNQKSRVLPPNILKTRQ